MIRTNSDVLKIKQRELQYFEGYLPSALRAHINIVERDKFLKHKKSFKELWQKGQKERLAMRQADDVLDFTDECLVRWLKKNPEFLECFIRSDIDDHMKFVSPKYIEWEHIFHDILD